MSVSSAHTHKPHGKAGTLTFLQGTVEELGRSEVTLQGVPWAWAPALGSWPRFPPLPRP